MKKAAKVRSEEKKSSKKVEVHKVDKKRDKRNK